MALAQEKIIFIENAAKDVLKNAYGESEYHNITPPIELSKVINKHGLILKRGKIPYSNVVGVYDKESKTILVSEDDAFPRQAFTIAHELGHFFLHEDKKKEIFYRSQSLLLYREQQEEEQEANWFAASLLMPEELIRAYWEITEHDQEEMTRIFRVSNTALYWRLKNLGLL